MTTERLYYRDSYLREFSARVVETRGTQVYLDRTAFYPASGGQPFDQGTVNGIPVLEVIDEEDRISHVLEAPLTTSEVAGAIDWPRRYDHMRQHTGQHLLSAVLEELFGIATVSFHLGAEVSTIDVDVATLSPDQMASAERRCAEIVAQVRAVVVSFEEQAEGLRKVSAREGALRIVSIEGIDRSACGGTHVRNTAEIGLILLGKTDRVRNTARIEFVCGARALRRARADFESLASVGRVLSVPVTETPELVAGLIERYKSLQKDRQRLVAELARHEGRALYESAAPSADGMRRVMQRGAIDDAARTRAQAFVENPKAVFAVVCEHPPSVLLAASIDSGIDAGDRMKALLAAHGGRGGGNRALAQARLPDPIALAGAAKDLESL